MRLIGVSSKKRTVENGFFRICHRSVTEKIFQQPENKTAAESGCFIGVIWWQRRDSNLDHYESIKIDVYKK